MKAMFLNLSPALLLLKNLVWYGQFSHIVIFLVIAFPYYPLKARQKVLPQVSMKVMFFNLSQDELFQKNLDWYGQFNPIQSVCFFPYFCL
jgi:hypothetical protein